MISPTPSNNVPFIELERFQSFIIFIVVNFYNIKGVFGKI